MDADSEKKDCKLAAIVQARVGSTRLPAKTLRLLAGFPLIQHVFQRLKEADNIDQVVLAVPDSSAEEPLIKLARQQGIETVKGPEEDVLQRFIIAGEAVNAEHILRVCSDNPLIDLNIINSLIKSHRENLPDYTFISDPIPLGTSAEVVRLSALQSIGQKTSEKRYQEHVTTYIHDNVDQFKIDHTTPPEYLLDQPYRLTVDTDEDFLLMEKLYDELFDPAHPVVELERVIQYLDTHPETACLNAKVKQKDWRLEK